MALLPVLCFSQTKSTYLSTKWCIYTDTAKISWVTQDSKITIDEKLKVIKFEFSDGDVPDFFVPIVKFKKQIIDKQDCKVYLITDKNFHEAIYIPDGRLMLVQKDTKGKKMIYDNLVKIN